MLKDNQGGKALKWLPAHFNFEERNSPKSERERLDARNQEIDSIFMNLYTDKAKGILTKQRFLKMTATLEQEQEANRKRIQDLTLLLRHSDEQESDVRSFIREIRRYAIIQELDEAVLNRLISRILMGEVETISALFFALFKLYIVRIGLLSITAPCIKLL